MSSGRNEQHERETYPTVWSQWTWDAFSARWYRSCLVSTGEYVYDYKDASLPNSPGSEDHDTQPSYSFARAEYSPATTYQDTGTYVVSDPYTTSTTKGYASQSDTNRVDCTWPLCLQTFGSFRDRDRHFRTVHSNNGERPYKCHREGCPASVTSWTNPEKLKAHNKRWHGPYTCQIVDCSRRIPHGFGSQRELDEHDRSEHGGPQTFSPASSQAYGLYSISKPEPVDKGKAVSYDFGPHSVVQDQQGFASYTPSSDFFPNYDGIAFATSTTQQGQASYSAAVTPKETNKTIQGSQKTEEALDPGFKIHHSRFFKPGQVFKILWSEPRGEHSNATEVILANETKYGQKVYSSIRRFVIVAGDHGHCQCLPILTYQNQGTKKSGVKREDHAIIYIGNQPPSALIGEEGLTKRPIQMIPKTQRDKLEPASRINYAKVYTVEHNVKVCFIGHIAEPSKKQMLGDFDNTWKKKKQLSSAS